MELLHCNVILASGPFLTPLTALVFLALLASPLLALTLFVYALVQFCRGAGERSFTCFVLGCLFLAPLLGLQTDGLHVLIIFAIVVAVAWPTWIYRVVRRP